MNTLNVDIFACMHFREFKKLVVYFKLALLKLLPLYGMINIIFTLLYIFSRIIEKQ